MNKIITLITRISEKAYAQSLKENTYVFNIEDGINKIEIKKAVEAQHKVDVLGVRVLVRKGKKARSVRIGRRSAGRPVYGRRSDQRVAYVTIKPEQKIKISAFEEVKDAA